MPPLSRSVPASRTASQVLHDGRAGAPPGRQRPLQGRSVAVVAGDEESVAEIDRLTSAKEAEIMAV